MLIYKKRALVVVLLWVCMGAFSVSAQVYDLVNTVSLDVSHNCSNVTYIYVDYIRCDAGEYLNLLSSQSTGLILTGHATSLVATYSMSLDGAPFVDTYTLRFGYPVSVADLIVIESDFDSFMLRVDSGFILFKSAYVFSAGGASPVFTLPSAEHFDMGMLALLVTFLTLPVTRNPISGLIYVLIIMWGCDSVDDWWIATTLYLVGVLVYSLYGAVRKRG